ncbi:MAG: phenylalanine--tRNA ligase subunit beta [Chthoniobacterales bacterium]
MKIALSWLHDYLKTTQTAEELAETLTRSGIEVKSISSSGAAIPNVVVAQILSSEQHPNADRLSVCKVDDGSGTPRQIVCGAKNYQVGDKILLALPGAVLPGGIKIKVGKLRGVESEGMMCSSQELHLNSTEAANNCVAPEVALRQFKLSAEVEAACTSEAENPLKLKLVPSTAAKQLAPSAPCSSSASANLKSNSDKSSGGLHILSPETVIGTELSALFPSDTILELEVTPNRPDWLGHVGVAREAAAFGAGEFLWSEMVLPPSKNDSSTAAMEASEHCPFYSLRLISNIAAKTAPTWLQRRLEAIGLRSINNIVDIANYVMMETAQPLHAFDADKIQGALTVRLAREGEKFEALDRKTYLLRPSDLVIADENGPQALAGIIGGLASSVTETTKSILLESAVFNTSSIRASARFHGLATDASYRFERGTQANSALEASARAVAMVLEMAGGLAAQETVIAGALPQPTVVPFRYDRCRSLLGISLGDEEISSLLKKLGLTPCEGGWQIPPWRLDLTREVDLIEEVARLYGLDSIDARHVSFSAPSSPTDKAYDAAVLLRRRLMTAGLHEARTGTLVSRESSSAEAIALRNPMGEQQSVLRTSLLPGLMEVLKHNLCQGVHTIKIFEIGKIFENLHSTSTESPNIVSEKRFKNSAKGEESMSLGLIMTGHAVPLSWRGEAQRSLDLYDLKGVLNNLVPGKISCRTSVRSLPSKMALMMDIFCDSQYCGYIACMTPAEARKLMVTGQGHSVVVAELEMAFLEQAIERSSWKKEGELPKFPSITRDLAVVVGKKVTYDLLEKELYAAQEPLLQKIVPLDVFTDPTGEKISVEKKSVTLGLTFQHEDRTLTAEEVHAICDRLITRLQEVLEVDIRF